MASIEEALQAKANAERKFAERDFVGAKSYALKAQMLCPHLEGISQMVATFSVHSAAEMKFNGEFDFYAILGMDPSANKPKLKKQYKRMAVLLHPDKNKTVGADGAFRLVSEAWTVLSDRAKRSSYDQRRSLFTLHASGVGSYGNFSNSSASHSRHDTFWTVCTSCQVQYEYLRKYVNKRLSCKNCRGVFIAVETGLAPANGSYAFSPWPYVPENGYKSHGSGVAYVPTSPAYPGNNGVPGHHSKHGSEHVSNLSFQWSSFPGTSAGVLDPNGSSTAISFAQQANTKPSGRKVRGKHQLTKAVAAVVANGSVGADQLPRRPGRPAKKRKVVEENISYSNGEVATKASAEIIMADGNESLRRNVKLPTPEVSSRRWPAAPSFDARQLLIDKARTDIRKKLEEIRLVSEAAALEAEKKRKVTQLDESSERFNKTGLGVAVHQSDTKKTVSMSMAVPDSDFHDFDKDRSEDCFQPKQIWALYDEEDGMPRLYCLIRQVISVQPFKIHISYLSAKTDSEFGLVNWLNSGFTKSCGKFRAFNSDVVEQVNIFSHLLSREKAGRGGCVQIYPKNGDVWAIYRNWSPDWNRKTPNEVRHRYEMVEVLSDYSEDFGVCVAPLVKLDGFKTVYQRNADKDAIRKITRSEMLRFSHQVPSRLLKGETMNLPEGCWELDPAATPDDLLQGVSDMQEERPILAERSSGIDLEESLQGNTNIDLEETLQGETNIDLEETLQGETNVDLEEALQGKINIDLEEAFQGEINIDLEEALQGETNIDLEEALQGETNIDLEEALQGETNIDLEEALQGETNIDLEEALQGETNINIEETLQGETNIDLEVALQGETNIDLEERLQGETNFDLEVTLQGETKIMVEDNLRLPEHFAGPEMLGGVTPGLQIHSNEQKTLFRPSSELPQSVMEPIDMENFSATPGEYFWL